ncbi:CAP family protein [Parasediminibacterium paludis]|uniref:CAP family protein n=1 Tax=Parasediminibacterium paludis TaxID=908966 RepID=A0ABV8PU76_9BACT
MYQYFLAAIIFINCAFANAQSITKTGSNISVQQAQEVLQHHNNIREKVGSPALVWNQQLAAYAQQWADYLANNNHCTMKHRDHPGEGDKAYGENIFWGSSSDYYKPMDASLSWYGEIKFFKYQRLNDNNWYKTGHYTQMVWKDTKEMGVGVAVCPNGGLIVVANYYPAGNVMTQYPY